MIQTVENKELTEFIRTHYASMYAVALKIAGSHDAAQDIIQDVITRFWQGRQKHATLDSVNNYLFIMVRNASLNYLRSRRREQVRYRKMEVEYQYEPDIFNILIEEEFNNLLMSAISKLPLQSARIIRLSLTGLDNREIAQLLGVSVNTVKTLKYGAIRRLREYFEKMNFDMSKYE